MNNTQAIFLMVAAMAFFAAVDAFVKLAGATLGVGQIIAVSSAGTLAIFWSLMLSRGEPLWSSRAFERAVLLRTCGEALGSIAIVVALGLAPLSSVIAVMQAQPLVVTVAAAVFLSEAVGWRRSLAIAIGFLGVMIVIRPGLGGFDPNLLWAVVALLGLTLRDLASRVLPSDMTTRFAVAWSMIPMTIIGCAIMGLEGGWRPMGLLEWIWLAGISVTVSIALWALTSAMRIGEVAAIAPFRYSRMVFAMIIAMVVFQERPDMLTWLGVALIIGSGIYAFWRENLLAGRQV